MPALTSLTITGAAPLGRALLALGRGIKHFVQRLKNRHDSMRLATLDERMLADIGLNRSDLRDAFAELPWRDPSEVLVRRAAERRVGRRLSDLDVTQATSVTAHTAMPAAACYPRADRPARYLV